MKKPTYRLDQLLVERGFFSSREKAQAAILAGEIWSENRRLEKAGEKYSADLSLEVKSKREKFVSRGGLKLEFAIENFSISVVDRVAMDIGSSTGGFTDCLLQKGAKHVFSVDVGYGQLDQSLRSHPQVTCLEKVNARFLTRPDLLKINSQASEVSILTMDVSFISVDKIIPQLQKEFPTVRDWIILFKPQFEVGRHQIRKGGVVKSEEAVQQSQETFQTFLSSLGFKIKAGPLLSPVEGKKSGNQEYLYHFSESRNPDVLR